jgi:uncharacterized repeat protein (TIGR01451 family)
MKIRNALLPFVAGIFLTLGLLRMLGGWPTLVIAAPAADITVCLPGTGTCNYNTIQEAVDAANDNDVIKVAAGIYTDTITRTPPSGYGGPTVITQVVYISKSLTIQGGYTTTDGFAVPDPDAYTTTLDAEGGKRVIFVGGDDDITVTLENLHITGGDAAGLGGVEGGATPTDVGGGMCVISATVTLSGNAIYNNKNLTGVGGGAFLYHSDDAILSDNEIYFNTTAYGGGLYVKNSDNAILDGNTIHTNQAIFSGFGFGGGVYLEESDDVTLSGNTIYNNVTAVGGGICLLNDDDTALSGNAIYNNIAGFYGGGIYLGGSNARLDNNVITDNYIGAFGSGIYVEGSIAHLRHNTLAGNAGGNGSGIHVIDYGGISSTVALTNTILVSHTVGITVANGNTATLRYTLWGTDTWANDQDWSDTGNITTGTVNIWDYPKFASDTGDYHIVAGSAAIDEGVDTGVPEDKDGVPRPRGGAPDLGAYEYTPPADLVIRKTVTPVTASPGDAITYTLTFSNAGWDTATSVFITDIVPVSVSVKGIISTGVTITDTSTMPPTYTWEVQDLTSGASGVIIITGVLSKPLAAGVFTNTAEITTTQSVDGDASNNEDSATVTILPADLVIVKTVIPTSPVNPGEMITYTLTFSNAGEGLATHVFITDVVPVSVTVKGIISTGVTITDISTTPPTFTWKVQDLAFEDGGVITITGEISKPLAASTFPNTATISTMATDSDTTDNTSSASMTVPNVAPVADDAIFSTDKDTSIHNFLSADDANGDPLTFGIFFDPITGDVAITDTVTGGFVYTPTEHAAPYTDTFTFVVTDTADLTDTAIITVIVTTEAAADLVIIKTVVPTIPVNPGSAIAYILAFSNAGPGLATDVVISDTIPASVTHTSVVSSSDVAITPVGDTRYVWEAANLASGAGGVITITGVLSDPLPPGIFTNTAAITTTAVDSDPDNNKDSASVKVVLPVGGYTEPISPLCSELAKGRLLLAIVIAAGISVAARSLTRQSLP